MLKVHIRSLTARQREIIELYVDDLEGRTTGQSSPSDEPLSNSGDNGTATFTRSSPSPEDGWMTRALNQIRGLIGF
jgi:molecular chaperone DnaJ